MGSKTKASHFDVSDDESFFNNSFTSILESSKRNNSKKSPSGDREFSEFQQFNETARSRQTMPSPKKRKKSQERKQPSSGFIREDENPDHMKRFSIPHEKTECTSTGLSNEQFSFFNDMINQKIHQSIQDNLMIEPCKNKNALNDQKTVHKNKHLPSTSLKINDDDLCSRSNNITMLPHRSLIPTRRNKDVKKPIAHNEQNKTFLSMNTLPQDTSISHSRENLDHTIVFDDESEEGEIKYQREHFRQSSPNRRNKSNWDENKMLELYHMIEEQRSMMDELKKKKNKEDFTENFNLNANGRKDGNKTVTGDPKLTMLDKKEGTSNDEMLDSLRIAREEGRAAGVAESKAALLRTNDKDTKLTRKNSKRLRSSGKVRTNLRRMKIY